MRAVVLVMAVLLAACQGGEGGARPEAAPAPFFVGAWAAEEAMCADYAWRFTAGGLSTPGEVSCTFETLTETSEGYVVEASCTAEGPPTPHRLRLLRKNGGLSVGGGPFAPIDLVACAPANQEAS